MTRRTGPPERGSPAMTSQPVSLTAALASFTDIYSPRIVTRVNDYDVRVAHAKGEHVWPVHDHTDEFFLVLDGQFTISLRDSAGAERVVKLAQGDVYVVPRGTEHKRSEERRVGKECRS